MSDPSVNALIAIAAGGMSGWIALWSLRKKDHQTWVMARAPELPIHALSVGDDAWINGVVVHDDALRCPWFQTPCVDYSYQSERKHTWTTTDKDGKTTTHSEWRVVHSKANSCHFILDDSTQIWIASNQRKNEAMISLGYYYEYSTLRHSASVLETGASISVLGVKQLDGTFSHQLEVPCLLTRATAKVRVQRNASSERISFFIACLLPAISGGIAALLVRNKNLQWEPDSISTAVLGAFLMWLPFWMIGTFNRLVRLRQQVIAGFRQVDIKLSVRAALVPNLIAVIKVACGHEQTLMAALANIRSHKDPRTTTQVEASSIAATRQVLALHESYPSLKSNTLFCDLHERLWACEEKIAHARQLYNDIVKDWNDRVQSFPSSLVARLAHCLPAPFFAIDDEPLPPQLRS
ncbi:MAG: LemA family protein [Planctomycetes bacterium]|nr:LemA family protein [Planctomycetota bacterium]